MKITIGLSFSSARLLVKPTAHRFTSWGTVDNEDGIVTIYAASALGFTAAITILRGAK